MIEVAGQGTKYITSAGKFVVPGSRLITPEIGTPRDAASTITNNRAVFWYCGQTVDDFAPKFVFLPYYASGNPSTASATVGIFSSPKGPNRTAQVLTKLVAGATADSAFTGATALVGNNASFSTGIARGTHIWSGFWVTGTSPQFLYTEDAVPAGGHVLYLNSASALTAYTTISPSAVYGDQVAAYIGIE